jgi:hypothetical protein
MCTQVTTCKQFFFLGGGGAGGLKPQVPFSGPLGSGSLGIFVSIPLGPYMYV